VPSGGSSQKGSSQTNPLLRKQRASSGQVCGTRMSAAETAARNILECAQQGAEVYQPFPSSAQRSTASNPSPKAAKPEEQRSARTPSSVCRSQAEHSPSPVVTHSHSKQLSRRHKEVAAGVSLTLTLTLILRCRPYISTAAWCVQRPLYRLQCVGTGCAWGKCKGL